MRHIPEEELHAYLDQALSRTQCVEIESHLAACDRCRLERDAIASLRDRTTALLATLAPRRRIGPSFELLSERAAARSARRAGRLRAAAWAASVLLAIGIGWGARAIEFQGAGPAEAAPIAARSEDPAVEGPLRDSSAAGIELAAEAPAEPAVDRAAAPRSRSAPAPAPRQATGNAREAPPLASSPAGRPALSEPSATMTSSGQLPSESFNVATGTLFRTVSWDRARFERGESVPRIAGLPVVEVQLAGSRGDDSRPLMVVAQQLESGQVIRTIEGPATDVNQLLASQRPDASSPWPTIGDDGIAGADGAMAVRRGDRILAITAPLPSDSLRAMIRRLNASERQGGESGQ
ncbi:MAG TPA: zf-HC2 domain-containing protein [Gemmatimonadales bacterium]